MARRWVGELADWSASLRFSGVTAMLVGLLALGVLIISPTLSTYVNQQRELAELRESVAESRDAVAVADAERLKWQDPAYVRAQARGRLFYVMPGETQLGIIDDVVIPPESTEETTDALTQRTKNWAVTLVAATLQAAPTESAVADAPASDLELGEIDAELETETKESAE